MEAAGRGSRMAGRRQVVKNMNTGGSPEECPVCLTGYDGTVQRPRTLPCGHTVCTLCIDQLEEQGRVACPECRVSHAVPEGEQFPVNCSVEAFIRMLRDAEEAAAAAASPPPSAGEAAAAAAAVASPPPSAGEGQGTAAAAAAAAAGKKEVSGLSKKMRSFLQEQEATVVAAITACREAQSQLDQYQTTLAGWGKRQQQLEDRLLGLVDQSRSAREDVCGLVYTDRTRGECGQFGIHTRDCKDGGVTSRVFGEVVDRLHVVAEAAQHRDIKEVTVADCGVVL